MYIVDTRESSSKMARHCFEMISSIYESPYPISVLALIFVLVLRSGYLKVLTYCQIIFKLRTRMIVVPDNKLVEKEGLDMGGIFKQTENFKYLPA